MGTKLNRFRQLLSSQIVRFTVVGLTTNLIGYAVYLLITAGGVAPAIAVTVLFGLGALISFLGNRRFTFGTSGYIKAAGRRYATVYFLGYLLNLSILLVFVDLFGMPHQFVQACAIFVVAGGLFLLSKYYVFSSGQYQSDESQ